MENNEKFATYEYTSINVKKELEAIYVDIYESFGWELVNNEISSELSFLRSKLSFKRDRKINNKNALNKLQKSIDVHFCNIDKLESQKYFRASFLAYLIGIISCVFMALSVFSITGYLTYGPLNFALQIVFGAIGTLLLVLPYFVYKNTVSLKTEEIQPLIDKEYDTISEICEEANLLVSTK